MRAPDSGEQGVTLLEIMIAMAVSMVVIVTISQTMVNAGRSAVSVRLDSITNSLISQTMSILRDPQLCARAFVDLSGNAIDINPASYPVNVPRFDFNGSYLARQNRRTSGVLVSSMVLDNPTLVAGARYRWSFKVTTQKVDEQGKGFGNTPTQIHNFRITITTNDGSPDYHVVSCGIENRDPLTIPPPAIVMGRSLLTIAAANTGSKRSEECNAIGSDYTPATLLDLVQSGAAPGNAAAVPTGAQPFLVNDDTANAYVLIHPPGQGIGMEIHNVGAVSGQVACVHKTAPLRFTTASAGTNFQPNQGTTAHNRECDNAFGPNYVEASFTDLLQYGFATVPAGALDTVPGYRDVTLGGANNTCRIAYHSVSSGPNNPVGLAIDCSKVNTQQNQIGCVVRTN